MKISVPGNALLLGEYAVLHEGGLGIAFAVEKRVRLHTVPAQSLFVEGFWPGGSFQWTPECGSESPVVSAAYTAVREWRHTHPRARARNDQELPAQRIQIDSSELYSRDGRKAGFGSSAAVAVALVAAFRADGQGDQTTQRLALAAHRTAQGGMGSGYDVCCSFYGGWGLFQGGVTPSWKPYEPRISFRVHLFSGPDPVSTQNAIQSFHQWKERDTAAAARFMERSNANVRAFLAAESASEVAAAFRNARDAGIELGDEIGVQARIAAPVGVDPELCKSLGAGNELGVYLQGPGAPEPPSASGFIPVHVDRYGIQWQQ